MISKILSVPRNYLAAATVLSVVALVGCGGDDKGDGENDSGGADVRVVERRQPQPAANGRDARRDSSARRPSNKSSSKSEPDEFASADPDDVFETGPRLPNFEIVGQASDTASEEFAVVVPPPGADSSTFAYTLPNRDRQRPPSNAVELPEGFEPIDGTGYTENGLPRRIRCEKDSSVMALVPAGVFTMGSSSGPPEASPELPVYLDAYYIDITEVTVAQMQTYLQDVRRSDSRPAEPPSGGNLPATEVTWEQARFYAQWAGKQLPTEAQWEKAARGEQSFAHVWGNGRTIWPQTRSLEQIDPVRSFRTDVSPYGVYDLAGNAREWCRDWFNPQAYEKAAEGNSQTLRNWEGPPSPEGGRQKSVRGNGPEWKAWHRSGLNMKERRPDVGFRCILTIDAPE